MRAHPQGPLLIGLLVSFNRVLMSLFAVLVRGRRVFFRLFVPSLMRCFMVVVSSGRLVCSGGNMVLSGWMLCHCHDRSSLSFFIPAGVA